MANTLRQLKRAAEIVERYRERGNVFPRELRDCGRGDPKSQQEYRDACKVKTWKYSLLGKNIYNCSDEVRDYLDENMPGWSDRVYSHQGQSSNIQMQKAQKIVERYRERGCVLPRRLKDPSKAQETKDAINISTWKSSLKGYNRVTCSKELCAYLDENMPGWRRDHHKSKPRSAQGKEKAKRALLEGTTTGELDKKERSTEQLMPVAVGIVERFLANNKQYPSLKLACRKDPSRKQEYEDAKKLHSWKSHIDKSLAPDVFRYLDEHMPDWKTPSHIPPAAKNAPISKAREIFRRCTMRGGALPRIFSSPQTTPEQILEHKDALKLREWNTSFTENSSSFCSVLREYLDEKIPLWRKVDTDSPLPDESTITASLLSKRKFETTVSDYGSVTSLNGTDGELSSSDGSIVGSDDEEATSSQGLAQRRRISCTPNVDESAGVAALLQLSTGVEGGKSGPHPVVSRPPLPLPPPQFGTMSTTFSSHSPTLHLSVPPAASFSTYGNSCRSYQPPMNSLYLSSMPIDPVPAGADKNGLGNSGLELYLTGAMGRIC